MDKRSFLFVLCVTISFFAIQSWFQPPKEAVLSSSIEIPKPTKTPLVAQWQENVSVQGKETFYVLENEYQQLVFSTRGGSLAVINLPLKSKTHPNSLVLEIGIDRQILEQSPQNSRFPLHAFYRPSSKGAVLESEGKLGGYYPLLRRSILNPSGSYVHRVPFEYYALNLTGDSTVATAEYRVTRFETNLIQFQASIGQRKITKTFSIPQDHNGPYCLQLDIQLEGSPEGLWLSSGVPDVEIVAGTYSPLLRYQTIQNNAQEVETISLPKGSVISDARPNWISNNNGFLGLILDPLEGASSGYHVAKVEGDLLPTRLSLIDASYQLYPASRYPGYFTSLPLTQEKVSSFRIFAGPYDDSLLKQLDALFDEPLKHYNPEYNLAQSIRGWFSFISEPFAKFLFFLMNLFHWVTRSWAASIVLLTIALRLMMYPLNSWSIRSMTKMQEMQPKIQLIQEKYKKDPRKAQIEVMNFYREHKINPMTGCLPTLLQMPFLIGMFYLLKSSFPLRGAPFIPGWINNLAAPDVVFSWNYPIWFIGTELHLLPILTGVVMYVQQKMTMAKLPKDSSQLTDSQKQQKMMGMMMPVVLTVLFYNFPSGLNLYFMFSTLLGVLQQWWIKRKTALSTT